MSGLQAFQSPLLVRNPYQFPNWASLPTHNRVNTTVFYWRRLCSISKKLNILHFAYGGYPHDNPQASGLCHNSRASSFRRVYAQPCFRVFRQSTCLRCNRGSNTRQKKKGMPGIEKDEADGVVGAWWRRLPMGTVTALSVPSTTAMQPLLLRLRIAFFSPRRDAELCLC